jgi:hypothetical protein
MALINQDNLAHYLKLNYNVLFKGRHGVGKTAIIKDVFEIAGLRWKYFSASTLDPWIDFVGMPRIIDGPGGPELKLIRPSFIEHDEVDAIFFDEYNRAPDKVINATMELIQFGSINGHKLKNLKVIWAAINPEDEEDTYSVNHLDPAHIDRFQVHIEVPYKIDEDWFMTKYPTVGRIFIDWWKQIPIDIRYNVSPRRLDYAADAYMNKCRLEDFLPRESNPKELRDMLKKRPFLEQIEKVSNVAEAIKFLSDVNNTTQMLSLLQSEESTVKTFFKNYAAHIPKELAAPFVECLQAKKAGFDSFTSIEEMIEKLPGDRGTAETGALINNVNLAEMFASGGNLHNALSSLAITKPQLINKLANRISDIMIGCTVPTITRLFWGPGGKIQNNHQNFQLIAKNLGTIHGAFTPLQKSKINGKLYSNKIVHNTDFLHADRV